MGDVTELLKEIKRLRATLKQKDSEIEYWKDQNYKAFNNLKPSHKKQLRRTFSARGGAGIADE